MTNFRENTKTPIPNFINSRTVPSVVPLSSGIGYLCNTKLFRDLAFCFVYVSFWKIKASHLQTVTTFIDVNSPNEIAITNLPRIPFNSNSCPWLYNFFDKRAFGYTKKHATGN